MGYTPEQIRAAVLAAVDEEFGSTYGGGGIADRVVEILDGGGERNG